MTNFVDFILNQITDVLTISVIILIAFSLWIQHHYAYWKRRNVPYIKPNPIFGNFKEMITWSLDPCAQFKMLYDHEMAKNQPVIGIYAFNKPCLLIRDPEVIKSVLIKDFNKFSDRYSASDPHSDPLGSSNLFFAKNPMWKEIRVKISPVFSSGKIKQMFPLVEEIGRELDRYLCSLPVDPKTNAIMREVKNINALYTTDVIATVAYGIQANSLHNPNGDFRTHGKRIFHFTKFRAFEFTSMFFLPSVVKLFGFKVFSKETSDFLRSTINYVIDERIKSGKKRNDLIDILVTFRKQAEGNTDKSKFVLEGDDIVAQAALFFSAGFETSSATMSFSLYELSKHQKLQQRLRDEIKEALQKNDGQLSYETISEMPFLNNVVLEVLRLYPPLPFLDRVCTLAQDEKPYSLKPFCDFAIPHGMPLYIPAYALHKDEKYFPDPDLFDPDRFAPENKDRANLSAYMPFGIGPHNCIGERFGLLQTKVGLIGFLRNHYVAPCEKSHPTMKLDPRAVIIQSEGGVYLNIVRDTLF